MSGWNKRQEEEKGKYLTKETARAWRRQEGQDSEMKKKVYV